MNWLEIVSVVVGILVGTLTITGILGKKIIKKFESTIIGTTVPLLNDQKKYTFDEINKMKLELVEDIQEITAELKGHAINNAKMRKTLMDLARDRINQAHKFYSEQGGIDAHSMYCIQQLGESYVDLGGNSFAQDEIENLKEMYCQGKKKKRKIVENQQTDRVT